MNHRTAWVVKRTLMVELRKRFAYEGKPLFIGLENLRSKNRKRIGSRFSWTISAAVKEGKEVVPVLISSNDSFADCAKGAVLQWLSETTVRVYAMRVDSQQAVG